MSLEYKLGFLKTSYDSINWRHRVKTNYKERVYEPRVKHRPGSQMVRKCGVMVEYSSPIVCGSRGGSAGEILTPPVAVSVYCPLLHNHRCTFSNMRVRRKHSQTWKHSSPNWVLCTKRSIYIALPGALYATHCSCSCGILLEMAIKRTFNCNQYYY